MANDPVIPSRCCTFCGHPLTGRSRPCPQCGRTFPPEPSAADAVWSTLGAGMIAVIIACFIAYVFSPPTVFADENAAAVLQQLHEDIIAQAKAQSMADGNPGAVPCFQVRRRGAAAVCITRQEWERQHEDDRTAVPEDRVGMRL